MENYSPFIVQEITFISNSAAGLKWRTSTIIKRAIRDIYNWRSWDDDLKIRRNNFLLEKKETELFIKSNPKRSKIKIRNKFSKTQISDEAFYLNCHLTHFFSNIIYCDTFLHNRQLSTDWVIFTLNTLVKYSEINIHMYIILKTIYNETVEWQFYK